MTHRKVLTIAAALAWIAAAAAGMFWFTYYSSRPGALAAPAAGLAEQDGARPELVVMLHPKCPCSRATLAEIERLLARNPDSITARAIFYKPAAETDEWVHTDIWNQATAIPGMAVSMIGDKELKEFGPVTSGQTFLYNDKGEVVFNGGVTVGRGHEGDNLGISSIEAYLREGRLPEASPPVFGCILNAPSESYGRDN